MSSYRTLIDLTSETLIKRTKFYKALVFVFSTIGVTALISAIATFSISPFIAVLLQIPAYGFFLVWDNKKLDQWRSQIIEAWQSKAIDISALNQAINANKTLPTLTIQGMLETLPELDDLATEQTISKSTRQAVSITILARDKLLQRNRLCKGIFSAIVVITIMNAVLLVSWVPFFALIMLPILLIFCSSLSRKQLSKIKTEIRVYTTKADIDLNKYNEILKSMNLEQII